MLKIVQLFSNELKIYAYKILILYAVDEILFKLKFF